MPEDLRLVFSGTWRFALGTWPVTAVPHLNFPSQSAILPLDLPWSELGSGVGGRTAGLPGGTCGCLLRFLIRETVLPESLG